MKISKLKNMVKGWFVGSFTPTAYRTGACEVAVKKYKAGDSEGAHYHKIATEVTLVLSGTVELGGRELNAGDIIALEPGETTGFRAFTNAETVVVKVPGVLGDKYVLADSK